MTKREIFMRSNLIDSLKKIPTSLTFPFQLVLATLFFLLIRIPYLNQEYAFEETLWFEGGLRFFRTGRLTFDWGASGADVTGFHKPPLFHLLLGAAGMIFGESELTFRMVPFLFSLFGMLIGCMLVKKLNGSAIIFAVSYIFFPFLVLGNNQINVDCSLVLCGYMCFLYGLVCMGENNKLLPKAGFSFTIFSVALLFCTRGLGLFYAMTISASLFFLSLFKPWNDLREWANKALYACLGGGVIGVIFMSLSSLAAKGNLSGWLDWINWIRGQGQGFHNRSGTFGYFQMIKTYIASLQGRRILIILSLGLAISLFHFIRSLYVKNILLNRRFSALFFIAMLIPTAFLIINSYNPEGFPRYFGSVIALSLVLINLPLIPNRSVYKFVCTGVLIYSFFNFHSIQEFYKNRSSHTDWYGEYGAREAGNFVDQLTAKDTFLISNSAVGYYSKRKYFDNEGILHTTTEEERKKIFESEKIGAWIFQPDLNGNFPANDPLLSGFKERIAHSPKVVEKQIGSLKVFIFSPIL
jgi:hypothetical protein